MPRLLCCCGCCCCASRVLAAPLRTQHLCSSACRSLGCSTPPGSRAASWPPMPQRALRALRPSDSSQASSSRDCCPQNGPVVSVSMGELVGNCVVLGASVSLLAAGMIVGSTFAPAFLVSALWRPLQPQAAACLLPRWLCWPGRRRQQLTGPPAWQPAPFEQSHAPARWAGAVRAPVPPARAQELGAGHAAVSRLADTACCGADPAGVHVCPALRGPAGVPGAGHAHLAPPVAHDRRHPGGRRCVPCTCAHAGSSRQQLVHCCLLHVAREHLLPCSRPDWWPALDAPVLGALHAAQAASSAQGGRSVRHTQARARVCGAHTACTMPPPGRCPCRSGRGWRPERGGRRQAGRTRVPGNGHRACGHPGPGRPPGVLVTAAGTGRCQGRGRPRHRGSLQPAGHRTGC